MAKYSMYVTGVVLRRMVDEKETGEQSQTIGYVTLEDTEDVIERIEKHAVRDALEKSPQDECWEAVSVHTMQVNRKELIKSVSCLVGSDPEGFLIDMAEVIKETKEKSNGTA